METITKVALVIGGLVIANKIFSKPKGEAPATEEESTSGGGGGGIGIPSMGLPIMPLGIFVGKSESELKAEADAKARAEAEAKAKAVLDSVQQKIKDMQKATSTTVVTRAGGTIGDQLGTSTSTSSSGGSSTSSSGAPSGGGMVGGGSTTSSTKSVKCANGKTYTVNLTDISSAGGEMPWCIKNNHFLAGSNFDGTIETIKRKSNFR